MRVITFSKVFPAHHPRKGEETGFKEKILNGTKLHTIRAGHRFYVGDFFSAREWVDKPYRSRQNIIADGVPVEKTWIFNIDPISGNYLLDGIALHIDVIKRIAKNDGFDNLDDFELWFPKAFFGQIICWDRNVNY